MHPYAAAAASSAEAAAVAAANVNFSLFSFRIASKMSNRSHHLVVVVLVVSDRISSSWTRVIFKLWFYFMNFKCFFTDSFQNLSIQRGGLDMNL